MNEFILFFASQTVMDAHLVQGNSLVELHLCLYFDYTPKQDSGLGWQNMQFEFLDFVINNL